ncbi:synaptonemal complex protein 2-like [Petaurus breviceps papuanus]|uniref:synaptonemal complex protein 2-like n=1 Tax=Petaurus breviceps papuanus TaxID=3040969 RepID=UPI0036DA5F0C
MEEIKNENAPEDDESVSAEFSLQKLIIDAFHGHGFEKIGEYLQQKENSLCQKYDQLLLIHLDGLINKELDNNEFHRVSLLLKCIQMFFINDTKEDEQLLIQQGLIPKMASWFERAIGFLTSGELTITMSLVQVIEDFLNTALVISKFSHKGKTQLDSFLFNLGHLVANKTINYLIRQEGLRTLNSILKKLPRGEREKSFSEAKHFLMKGLARAILDTGDYDMQVALLEALCRMMSKKSQPDLAHTLFEDDTVAIAFKDIRDREFETDSRRFLNYLNDKLGDKRRVYTFPCIAALVDGYEVRKPHDENLEKFWIDFNIGSESITFYIDNAECELWDSVRLLKEAIGGFSIKETGKKKVLVVYLKKPHVFNNKKVMKVEIHFDLQCNILKICMKVLGPDKYLLSPSQMKRKESLDILERFDEQEKAGITCCDEKKAAQEPMYREESVQDDKNDSFYQPSQEAVQSETTKSYANHPSAHILDLEYSSQEAAASKQNSLDGLKEMDKIQAPKLDEKPSYGNSPMAAQAVQKDVPEVGEGSSKSTSEHSQADGLEKKRKGTSWSKDIPETQENPYDFGNDSDTVDSQVVIEAKQRLLSHKESSKKKRDSSTFSSFKSQGESKLFDDFRKHLFSESDHETSSDMSRSSWNKSQKEKNIKTYSKQKKPRVRRKLRVLPLSPASSGSDYQKDKATPVGKRISRQNNEKNSDFPVLKFQDSTVFLTPKDSAKKKSFLSVSPFSDASSPEDSAVTEDLSMAAASKSSMESPILKRKTQNVGVSDLSDSTLIKPKQRKLEEGHTPFSPVALMPGENPVPAASQVIPDNLGEPAVISTFENFTNELKKKFESRNKEKDTCFQNATKASEKLALLLNQIHQCRLDKIEQFHKSILHELDNFKKDMQTLKDLEKEILDVWKEQSTKLNSFCDLEMQSLNHLRKR